MRIAVAVAVAQGMKKSTHCIQSLVVCRLNTAHLLVLVSVLLPDVIMAEEQ